MSANLYHLLFWFKSPPTVILSSPCGEAKYVNDYKI